MPETVLITGGVGFIGPFVVDQLLERGHEVVIFDNLCQANSEMLDELTSRGARLVEGDVRYRSAVARALEGIDRVIHLAAVAINRSVVDPEESVDINLVGSNNVFAAAAAEGVRRVVFASSASVYGEPQKLPMHEDELLNPLTPYCTSKLASEHLLRFYGEQRGLSWNALPSSTG